MNAPLFAVRSKRFHDWLMFDKRSWSPIEHRRGAWSYADARELAANNNGYAVPINDEEDEEPETPMVIDHEGEGRPWVKR